MGPMPLQLSPIGPEVRPDRQADPVMHQVAEQPVQAPLAIELVEDDPHHLLRLLVGVEGQPAAGLAPIADRRGGEKPPPGGPLFSPPLPPRPRRIPPRP